MRIWAAPRWEKAARLGEAAHFAFFWVRRWTLGCGGRTQPRAMPAQSSRHARATARVSGCLCVEGQCGLGVFLLPMLLLWWRHVPWEPPPCPTRLR